MKTTLKTIWVVMILGLIVTSCGDERPGKIEEIKMDETISSNDKLLKIMDIASKCLTCGERSIDTGTNEDGVNFAIYEYMDDDFIFTSTEAMQRIVTSNIARIVWRTFHATQNMGIDAIALDYYGYIRFDTGFDSALIYELVVMREELESIDGFYDLSPYDNQDLDVYDVGSEQDQLIDQIRERLEYLTDNSSLVQF
jgi:hypothetical protein